jgi:hypothetical protein
MNVFVNFDQIDVSRETTDIYSGYFSFNPRIFVFQQLNCQCGVRIVDADFYRQRRSETRSIDRHTTFNTILMYIF